MRFRPQFEIERARQAIEDLKPMFDQNKETLARAEIEVEHLEKEVGTIQANLDREQKTIVSLRDSIKTGDIRLAGHVKGTESGPRPSWPIGWITSGTLRICSSRRPTSSQAKQKIIRGAHEQLETLQVAEVDASSPGWPTSKPSCS